MPEADQEVQILRCADCGRLDPGPRFCCAGCQGTRLLTHRVPGRGRLVSWTLIRRPPEAFAAAGPVAVGVLELEAGVRVTARLELAGAEPALGARFHRCGGSPLEPSFAPESP